MHFDLTASRIWLLFYDFYAVLIRGEALIRGTRAYFNVDTKRCSAY